MQNSKRVLGTPAFTKAVNTCPAGCTPAMVIKALPPYWKDLNARCRCMWCLTRWEVTSLGIVTNLRLGSDVQPPTQEKERTE